MLEEEREERRRMIIYSQSAMKEDCTSDIVQCSENHPQLKKQINFVVTTIVRKRGHGHIHEERRQPSSALCSQADFSCCSTSQFQIHIRFHCHLFPPLMHQKNLIPPKENLNFDKDDILLFSLLPSWP